MRGCLYYGVFGDGSVSWRGLAVLLSASWITGRACFVQREAVL